MLLNIFVKVSYICLLADGKYQVVVESKKNTKNVVGLTVYGHSNDSNEVFRYGHFITKHSQTTITLRGVGRTPNTAIYALVHIHYML